MTASQPTLLAIAVTLLPLLATVMHAQELPPTMFVGPQLRDGLLDVDAGIRDSIRDIRRRLGGTPFKHLENRDEAIIVLLVLGRGVATQGSVGIGSVPGLTVFLPIEKPTLTTLLRVGTYERAMQSAGDSWGEVAEAVLSDVEAWWEANGATVRARVR